MELESKRKAFITNIRKHLESCGAEFEKKSDNSNSIYLRHNGTKIRISDHISPSFGNRQLDVIVCGNNVRNCIVNIGGTPLVYNTTKELKSFLKSWCDFHVCFNFSEDSQMKSHIMSKQARINELSEEIKAKKNEVNKLESKTISLNNKINDLKKSVEALIKCNNVDFDSFTPKQQQSIYNLIAQYGKQYIKK